MTPEQHPILLGDLESTKHDLWFEYCSQEETPDPQAFTSYAARNFYSYLLYQTQETELSFTDWQARRVLEDVEGENG